MIYDLDKLNDIVKSKKQKFISLLCFVLLLAIVCILLISFSGNREVIVLSGIGLFTLFVLSEKLFSKYSPKALFSKEIKGENIKESEYEIMKRGSVATQGMRYRQVGSRSIGTRSGAAPIVPSTGANRKAFHQNMRFSGEVYLKSDDGNIYLLTGLYGSHLEIYEEGDTLLKPRGCKFPIVINRNACRQPCPVCGEVNGEERDACAGCGLEIMLKGDSDEHKI